MTVEELVEVFELLGDWEERYRYLIDLGRKLPPLPESDRTEANKVRGCMSQVWLTCHINSGPPKTLEFRGDSDSHLVKGLIALLFTLYAKHTPPQILALDVAAVFGRLGLENHVSMNRRNGFYAMVERIRAYALQSSPTGSIEKNP